MTITAKVNVVLESTVDPMTRKRLTDVLTQHGIKVAEGNGDAGNVNVRLGTVGSGEEVETYAYEHLALKKESIMRSDRFDRHAIKVDDNGITILGEHTNAVFCALASLLV